MKAGRLRVEVHRTGLRHSEVRWMGPRVQWVVSPVQVALWTHMHRPLANGEPYNWRVNWCPIPR